MSLGCRAMIYHGRGQPWIIHAYRGLDRMTLHSFLDWLRAEVGRRAPEVSYCQPDDPLIRQLFVRAIERLTGQPRLQRIYDEYNRTRGPDDNFWQSAVSWLQLKIRYDGRRLENVPADGPLIVIANHPYGVLDGIAVSYLTSLVRKDFKLLAHETFGRAEPLRPYLIPITFDGASSAVRQNVEAKKTALRHLGDGGSIVIFPAGRVSTASNVFGRATDAPWKLFAGKLIATSNATVVPMFTEGQNGFMFHLGSRFSEALRDALLLREVARRIGADVTAHIGTPIQSSELKSWTDRQALLDHLRDIVYCLDPTVSKRLDAVD
ncbi:MAG: lysophospholipid acyltransferase family protein [Pseudomonadota bacterium]